MIKKFLFKNEYIQKTAFKNYLLSAFLIIKSLISASIPLSLVFVIDAVYNKNLYKLSLLLIITLILNLSLLYMELKARIIMSNIEEQTKIEITNHLIKKVLYQKASNIDKDKAMSWIFNEVENISQLYLKPKYMLYSSASLIIFSVIELIYFNIYLLFLAILLSLFIYYIPQLYVGILQKQQTEYNNSQKIFLSKIDNFFRGIFMFIYSNKIKNFEKALVNESNIIKEAELKNFKVNQFYALLNDFVNRFSIIIINICTYILIYFNYLTFGMFAGVSFMFKNFSNSVLTLSSIIGYIKVGESIFNKFNNEIILEIDKGHNIKDIENIKLDNVTIKYDNKTVFDNYSLNFEKGKKYILKGASGSGKSTLIKIILGLKEYEGSIKINNIDIKNINHSNLYSKIEYVDDSSTIIYSNIYDNISLFNEYNKEKIEEIIDLLNLSNIDKEIELNDKNISTGERQRINLARMIYQNKELLLLDEIMANIDKDNVNIVEDYLKNSNKTIILVSHHIDENIKNSFNIIDINNIRVQ